MKKYWVALLLTIAVTEAYAGEKEYTVRYCESIIGWYADEVRDCNKCKEIDGHKISFKVSKQLKSVMLTGNKYNGEVGTSIEDNCKIFDENSFQCLTERKEIYLKDYIDLGMIKTLVVSNGKWERTTIEKGSVIGIEEKTKKLKKGEKVSPDKYQVYSCGYEIKNVFNFFK